MSDTAREALRALVKASPLLNQSDLAERLGISRQRVSQLVKAEGLAVRRGVPGVGQRRAASAPAARVITGGVPVRISHTIAGTIGELLVAADLMARGYAVFYPLARTTSCDLIALPRSGMPLTIEVRCGHRSGARVVFTRKETSTANHYAIVITGEPVLYKPLLE